MELKLKVVKIHAVLFYFLLILRGSEGPEGRAFEKSRYATTGNSENLKTQHSWAQGVEWEVPSYLFSYGLWCLTLVRFANETKSARGAQSANYITHLDLRVIRKIKNRISSRGGL